MLTTLCAPVLVQVPLAQKWMIAKANLKGRPVIVSGHMLASMVDRCGGAGIWSCCNHSGAS